MRIAYLDCFSGISGDMFLGALVDAGVSPDLLRSTVEALNVNAQLAISRVDRSGISAIKIDVLVDGKTEPPRGLADRPPHSRERHPAHPHPHGVDHHPPEHEPWPEENFHTHAEAHGRSLTEISKIINSTGIAQSAKHRAITMFEKLGSAEAKIHALPVAKIHFHEVGAIDAMVDIVCAAVGAEALGVEEFICSPLNVGSGTVVCSHGTFPVPAPATVELLRNAPVYSSGMQAELVTPTGAAIVATLAAGFAPFPQMRIQSTGYGAGSRDLPGHPNVLRMVTGEAVAGDFTGVGSGTTAPSLSADTVAVLEANLDDLNPQVLGYAMERLFGAGALEVFGTAVQMKKNRPGTLLTVLAKPEDTDKLAQILFAETTTLGIRRRQEERQLLARRWETVSTRFGEVRIKVGSLNGTVSTYTPEYEDCRRIAAAHRVPLKQVMQEAVQGYLRTLARKE
jgi:uncharacterized protein (TIGR00299 family) protein